MKLVEMPFIEEAKAKRGCHSCEATIAKGELCAVRHTTYHNYDRKLNFCPKCVKEQTIKVFNKLKKLNKELKATAK